MRKEAVWRVRWVPFLGSFLFLILFVQAILGDEQEYRLTRYLLANYDSAVRPSKNASEALSVTFDSALHSIIDVDEKNQILTTNCWLTLVWMDAHLTWNSTDFGGVKVIRVPFEKVWKPDIILYNNADSQYGTSTINTNVIVKSTGEVTWLSHGIYRSSCDINVEFFPFDIQKCKMKWSSWTYDGYQLDLQQQGENGDVTNFKSNGEFDLLEFSSIRNVEHYSCCPEPYTDITYTIRLRRRPMFYVFNLILPCVLINGIALLVFYVPSDSGEKITLGISALLSMTVFLMTIRESLPPTEKTPLISLYYGVTICLISFASALSVLTLNIHHRGGRGIEPPLIVKKIILGWIAKFVLLQLNEELAAKKDKSNPCSSVNSLDLRADLGEKFDMEHIPVDHFPMQHPRISTCHFSGPIVDPLPSPQRSCMVNNTQAQMGPPCWMKDFDQHLVRVLNKVHQTIEKNEMRMVEQDRRETAKVEWQQIALVCDRLLLILFSVATVIATSIILLSSPHGP